MEIKRKPKTKYIRDLKPDEKWAILPNGKIIIISKDKSPEILETNGKA